MNTFLKTLRSRFGFSPGFSLLELLVVISIIGILIAMGSVAFTTAQRKSRDARRRSDIKAFQNALEQYHAANNSTYPNGNCATLAAAYFSGAAPTDPKNDTTYFYQCTSTVTGYCACALLDESGKGNAGANCNYGAATKTHYCLSNLQ